MRERNSCNYRMYNVREHRYCGHYHHSRKSAMRCADGMGWNKNLILVLYDSSRKSDTKRTMHDRMAFKPTMIDDPIRASYFDW